MSNEEFFQLVDDYNAAETLQRERLLSLFRELKTRKGGARFVQFGNSKRWGPNDVQEIDEVFSVPAVVDVMVQKITSFNPGEE